MNYVYGYDNALGTMFYKPYSEHGYFHQWSQSGESHNAFCVHHKGEEKEWTEIQNERTEGKINDR